MRIAQFDFYAYDCGPTRDGQCLQSQLASLFTKGWVIHTVPIVRNKSSQYRDTLGIRREYIRALQRITASARKGAVTAVKEVFESMIDAERKGAAQWYTDNVILVVISFE
jgi:hypothetical protein